MAVNITPKQLESILAAFLQNHGPFILGIDGRSAAGKSTLAASLAKAFNAQIIHMDDFFVPRNQRNEGHEQPGNNVDWHRFHEEVINPLQAGIPFSYQPFDCRSQSFKNPVPIDPARPLIIEGCYSLHPENRTLFSHTLFMDIHPDFQKERLMNRAPQKAQDFFDHWIPLEEQYFRVFHPEKNADFLIKA